jgi:hypothetical protein
MLNLRENIKTFTFKSTSNWNKYECIVLDPEKQNQEIKYT